MGGFSCGVLALCVGAAGVYSLIAYIVSWRTREIGIRLALSAARGRIVKVMKQSALWAIAGSVAGLAGAFVAARLQRQFLLASGRSIR